MRHNFLALKFTACLGGVVGVLFAAGNAWAGGGFDQDQTYSLGYGMQPGEENMGASGSTRDANGNRVFINGVEQGVAYPVTDAQSAFAQQSGVGNATSVPGASATAVGNALNVTVQGSWNTVIVNSTQVNNGDQTATLNGNIHF